jgi:glycosyltransferase involved in cell wall biosynthesis
VAPWARRAAARRRPLAGILHQPPGGIDHAAARRWAQAVLDRDLYRHCQLLIAASDALRDDLVSAPHRLPASRIRVVAPGSDVAPRPTGPVPDLRHGRRAAAVSVGNWMARKGTLELLDALHRLPDDRVTLHLAGRDDVEPAYTEQVRARLAALGDRVVHHGVLSRDGVARLYAGADVFVLPSRREPYGTVYGEALAAGLPVVGWRAGNLPHLITDGVEGVILDPGDVPGLAVALDRLATDVPWRAGLAEAATRRGAALPTWADTASAVFAALRELLASTR